MEIPDDLSYTEEHEWIRPGAGGAWRVGITDYAQDALGDVVYVDLPELGKEVLGGDPVAEVESTKSVAEVYAPVAGTVTAINEELRDHPELVNEDPYGAGWFVELRPAAEVGLDALLDAEAYRRLTEA
ncbi:MAG: glycine cleavage system protein GcvH [Acidimicrobiia bacterium]